MLALFRCATFVGSCPLLHRPLCDTSPPLLRDMYLYVQLPTSKSDIFTDSSLSLLEKRKLMKFLQFAMDLHTVRADGTPVDRLNEYILGQGRSLLRYVCDGCSHPRSSHVLPAQ